MDKPTSYSSLEQARNAAIKWLEDLGAIFGPRKISIGQLGTFMGKEVGTESMTGPFWRLRIDYDPAKGCHFNAEWDKGAARKKHCFQFPGGEKLAARLASTRAPR
jgi:hypothetical protein